MLWVTEGSSQWPATRCLTGCCILVEVLFWNIDMILGSGHTPDRFLAQHLIWKGGRQNPSRPWLKIISEGCRPMRGDASYFLEQLMHWRSPESQFQAFSFLSFCLPYLLFFSGYAAEASQIKLGKLWGFYSLIFSPRLWLPFCKVSSLSQDSWLDELLPHAQSPGAQFGNSTAPHGICWLWEEASWLADVWAQGENAGWGKWFKMQASNTTRKLETQRRFQPGSPIIQKGSGFSH